mgnify:CR=1 FL=1
MNRFDFHIPVNIVYGRGEISRLERLIPDTAQRILIVTDPGLYKNTPVVQQVEALCGPGKVRVYADIEENPSLQSIEKGGMLAGELGSFEWMRTNSAGTTASNSASKNTRTCNWSATKP